MLKDRGGIVKTGNEALIKGCLSGDRLAWETLVERYQRLVYSIPQRAGLDQAQSAEVFQQVFEKLVKHLDQIEQPDRLGAWLAITACRETWHLSQREGLIQKLIGGDEAEDEINHSLSNAAS
jgi:RNA polymerase sigma factor (sigma-70 family)